MANIELTESEIIFQVKRDNQNNTDFFVKMIDECTSSWYPVIETTKQLIDHLYMHHDIGEIEKHIKSLKQ